MNCRPQRDCEQLTVLVSFFQNSTTKRSQMAAPSGTLFHESFHATQTRVEHVYVQYIHEYIGTSCAWASKCYICNCSSYYPVYVYRHATDILDLGLQEPKRIYAPILHLLMGNILNFKNVYYSVHYIWFHSK